MAPLRQHMEDCRVFLGSAYEEVNRWMDELFATAGAEHRRYRHHTEGIREARKLFGEDGARAAIVHILRDCRNIPTAEDYETGVADRMGLKAAWPASAYVHYTEEAFATLVKNTLEGPMAVVLWIFIRSEADIVNLLTGLSRLSAAEQELRLRDWRETAAQFSGLSGNPIPQQASFRDVDSAIQEYCEDFRSRFSGLFTQLTNARFAMVPVDLLITPLTLIDYEYVEELKAELTGTDLREISRFALPEQTTFAVKTALDMSGRSVTFISTQKTLTVSPLQVTPMPGAGVEVKVAIGGSPQLILVSHVAGRLYLRSGIHRAYLLASLGLKEIPCILSDDATIPAVGGPYPAFASRVLALPRPPLLRDALDPALTLQIPVVRTNLVIRISVDNLVLPVS